MVALLSPSSPDATPDAETAQTLECRRIESPAELSSHGAIRTAVFVTEQGIFDDTDLDERDADPETQHVLGWVDGEPAGTVRIFRLDATASGEVVWKGDRLAVLPEFRQSGIGGALVRHAVASAAEAGGDRMIAWIQLSNVSFFRHLGWTLVDEPDLYLGKPHQQVTIGLR